MLLLQGETESQDIVWKMRVGVTEAECEMAENEDTVVNVLARLGPTN